MWSIDMLIIPSAEWHWLQMDVQKFSLKTIHYSDWLIIMNLGKTKEII